MDFITHIREALLNLVTSKLRSFLAILGILVGTGSVVALISSSYLATEHALEQFRTLGTNLLAANLEEDPAVAQQSGGQGRKLELNDLPQIAKASNQIALLAPYTTLYQELIFKGQTFNGAVLGTTDVLDTIVKIEMDRGRFISYLDRHNFYCVIGSKIAEKIQEMGIDPMYKQIKIGNNYFTIIGIAKPWQPNMFLFADINNGAIIPLQASYLLSSYAQINDILFRLVPKPNLDLAQKQIAEAIKRILPQKRVEFRNPEQIMQIVAKQRVTFTLLLSAIGGISLIVGGIGVMNIMLVSVVERRREIGIRLAIGARQQDILKMFLIESVILTLFGGAIGVLLGVTVSFILAYFSNWMFHLYLLPPLLGFIVSVLVGIISGFYPAYRASRLDPIQSLTAET